MRIEETKPTTFQRATPESVSPLLTRCCSASRMLSIAKIARDDISRRNELFVVSPTMSVAKCKPPMERTSAPGWEGANARREPSTIFKLMQVLSLGTTDSKVCAEISNVPITESQNAYTRRRLTECDKVGDPLDVGIRIESKVAQRQRYFGFLGCSLRDH